MKKIITIGLILQMLSALTFGQPTAYGNNAAAGRYYAVNNIKLYVEQYGSGMPLLMLHGNGGNMSAFSHNVPYFSKKYRVILVDSRAQGKSVDDSGELSFEQMADDFAALLKTMHISKAYVVGWSDGGITALLMAMRHPDQVIKLAATGANIWPDSTAINPQDWIESKKYYEQNKDKKWLTDNERNAWKLFMLDWQQPNLKPADLKKVKCPALIIAGDHDIITDKHTRIIHQNIPGARLWIVPKSGHGTLIEHAHEFNKRVDQFFQEKRLSFISKKDV